MANNPIIVAPRSRKQIEEYALAVRRALGVSDGSAVDMLRLLELVLPRVLDEYSFEVVADRELGEAEATTSMTERSIKMGLTCYEAARQGQARYAFTLAHELGHLLMHTGSSAQMARGNSVKPYVNAEWQADTFASAFLMPEGEVRRCSCVREILTRFRVSRRAAEVRASVLNLDLPF
ncbi:ImmA/IrrE family metallo-endopeptidase [Sphingomonas sp. URHD0057]|uniref:ImmA/IrrE family metallo-endopeptidase n=1 Tax=Sphingomonas sp. URHD0057 TaxID=1380389 RepID=UPI001E4A9A4D|nr:ImmA/IrrE family metallo-endopeptidase [Sphingomonas sp. URHD0057]